ncbi:MAG: histidine phosphatase family protein [Deltaproteobacteria bacterium]|nr:histidine phosphatase family protein [Deltaproteobacteria bacterium]
MGFTRLFLIRHGQVVNHHEFRYNGHFDVDITDLGVEQMNRVADFLAPARIKAIYSSDLQRAVKGAEIIAKRLDLKPTRIAALREIHLGRWEGLTREEASERFPEEAHLSFKDLTTKRMEGGESVIELRTRVLPAVSRLISLHPDEAIAIVAHGGVNRVILNDALDAADKNFFSIEQDYGCVNVIDYFSDGLRLVKLLNGGPNQELKPPVIY